MDSIFTAILAFAILVLSAKQIGVFFTRFNLPLVTGYLITGIIIGPFVLALIDHDSIETLFFIDEISLAMIAFIAGSELYLKELRSRIRSILIILASLAISIYILGSLAFFLLADWIPFMAEMPTDHRIAVALIAGSILIARSPSSAIAVINELRARGPYTKMVLGVTVAMDMVVITLFAISSSIADAALTNLGFDLTFVEVVVVELTLSVVLGFLVSRLLYLVLMTSWSHYMKLSLIAAIGFAIFALSIELRHWTAEQLGVELLFEPLLICLLASFFVTNYSPYRLEFTEILHKIAPVIYVLFFTLTGAALELDLVVETWGIMLVLLIVRLIGIVIGTFTGGTLAGEPMRYNRISWMSFVTQAGIGLGLATEVAVQFPEWGESFATILIAVIVINELVGPPLFRAAIKKVGEAHVAPLATPDEVRDAVIIGVNSQAIALARQLREHDWRVTLADLDPELVERCARAVAGDDINIGLINQITARDMRTVMSGATDAVVSMLPDDQDNFAVAQISLENFGIPRRIVRINDPSWSRRFQEVEAVVVDPTSAMVNVLDQCVRSPQSAELLLSDGSQYDTVQVKIVDPDVVGMAVRDLYLPDDVLILGIRRRNQWIMPHGYTILRLNDEVTFLGRPESLIEVKRRFGY